MAGQGRKREVPSSLMIEALKETNTMEAASRLAGCSAPLITHRAKTDMMVLSAVKAQDKAREDKIAKAILAFKGNLSQVAVAVGMESRASVSYHISRSPVLQQVMQDAKEGVADKAETNVFEAVEEGNLQYSWKILTTLGKDRGYTERKEIDQHVTHSVDEASTASLISLLNGMAGVQPEAIEAEFEVLGEEDKGILANALQEAQEKEEGEGKVEDLTDAAG